MLNLEKMCENYKRQILKIESYLDLGLFLLLKRMVGRVLDDVDHLSTRLVTLHYLKLPRKPSRSKSSSCEQTPL